jgi:hypothetical protein
VGDDRRSRSADYRGARIGAAVSCFGIVVLMLIWDALSTDYAASELIVAMVLATGATLLGVEVRALRDRLP